MSETTCQCELMGRRPANQVLLQWREACGLRAHFAYILVQPAGMPLKRRPTGLCTG
jgi:hypothetical protein